MILSCQGEKRGLVCKMEKKRRCFLDRLLCFSKLIPWEECERPERGSGDLLRLAGTYVNMFFICRIIVLRLIFWDTSDN